MGRGPYGRVGLRFEGRASATMAPMGRERVVIVGGGFGGLACARALDGADVDVLLLDARNNHLFTPLLYQVATALLDPSDIAYPYRTVFRRSPNVRFRQARVTGVDFEDRLVVEGADRLLGPFHPRLGAYAADTLRARGVEVRLSTLVREATDDSAVLSSAASPASSPAGGQEITIGARTIVWSAGVGPTDPLPD